MEPTNPSPIPLLLLDESSCISVLKLRPWRTFLSPVSFRHPGLLADHSSFFPPPSPPEPPRLPWNRFLSWMEDLGDGPVVLLNCVHGALSSRLEEIVMRLRGRGRVYLVLDTPAASALSPLVLERLSRIATSLIRIQAGGVEDRQALCLEDLSLALAGPFNQDLKGHLLWVGTPRSQSSLATIARALSEACRRTTATAHDLIGLCAHLPKSEAKHLYKGLRRLRLHIPCSDGRCCPDALRHSLRMGTFVPFPAPCLKEEA